MQAMKCMAVCLVMACAVIAGGPQGATTEVVGGDPLTPECNGTGIVQANCPGAPVSCEVATDDERKTELAGTVLDKRYNNDEPKCYNINFPLCKTKAWTLKEPDPTTCKQVLSTTLNN